MKFYSTKTKQFYNTIKECSDAEKDFEAKELAKKEAEEKKATERKEDATKVEDAYRKYVESQKATDELYKAYVAEKQIFISKYGAFHLTDNNGDIQVKTATDSFRDFTDLLDLFNFRFPF